MTVMSLKMVQQDPWSFVRLIQPLSGCGLRKMLARPRNFFVFEVMTDRDTFRDEAKLTDDSVDEIIRRLELRGYSPVSATARTKILFWCVQPFLPKLDDRSRRTFNEREVLHALLRALDDDERGERRFISLYDSVQLMADAHRPQICQEGHARQIDAHNVFP
jgi:hypothetical protein